MADYTLYVVADGLGELLARGINKETPDNLVVKYFTNDATVDFDTAVGDLTECVDAGYAEATLTGASWVMSESDPNAIATYTLNDTWTADGAVSLYGAYVTNAAGTILIGAAKFAAVKNLSAGDQVQTTTVTMRLQDAS